ncbi:MAG: hypothetical protein M3418_00210 [Gemmatimonadota bacterium]|nr:hypothetical protein [Gemmatimonadota bacterium]
MSPLQRLTKLAEHLALAETVRADRVLALLDPVIRQLSATEAEMPLDEQWISLGRAKTRCARSDQWFRAPLAMLGGRSRLQRWAEVGLARQEGRAWWVSVSVLPERAIARSLECKHDAGSARTPTITGMEEPAAADILYDDLNRFIAPA